MSVLNLTKLLKVASDYEESLEKDLARYQNMSKEDLEDEYSKVQNRLREMHPDMDDFDEKNEEAEAPDLSGILGGMIGGKSPEELLARQEAERILGMSFDELKDTNLTNSVGQVIKNLARLEEPLEKEIRNAISDFIFEKASLAKPKELAQISSAVSRIEEHLEPEHFSLIMSALTDAQEFNS